MLTVKSIQIAAAACLFVASLVATCVIIWPSYRAIKAGIELNLDANSTVSDGGLSTRRQIQKHFLGYGIYIPIDDIIVKAASLHEQELLSYLSKTCGNKDVFIWVPLRFRFPIVGEKVKEWCLSKN